MDLYKKHPFITGSVLTIVVGVISGFIFYYLLLAPGYVYAEYKYDDANTIREVQLMLSLRGTKTEKPIKIDGKLGLITKEAIKNYQINNNLKMTGDVSGETYQKLYEDTKTLLAEAKSKNDDEIPQATADGKTVGVLAAKLDNLENGLRNTNNSVKSLVTEMPYHFITSYRDLVAIIGVGLGIIAGLLGGIFAWGILRYSPLSRPIFL